MINVGPQQQPHNPQLRALLCEFKDWCDARGRELDAANSVHDPLFHYTDVGGLLGIINSQEIWLTSIFHLNDPSELGYGIEMALDIFKAEAERGPDVVKAFCAWMKHLLVKAGGEIFGFFVGSFSRDGNDLGQWRAYSDKGRGVAVGLAPRLFHVHADQANLGLAERYLVARVIYDRNQCIQSFTDEIRAAVEIVVRAESDVATKAEGHQFLRDLATELVVPIFSLASTCKHRAYRHEQETRILLVNDLGKLAPIIETRTRGSTLVPFIRSPLAVRSAGAITQIMIGPAAERMSDHAVRALLSRHGLPLDMVQQSDIPYSAR
jgi:Protein of unknown function (DUF2971)